MFHRLLREEHEIWFWNVADLLKIIEKNPHFDIMNAVKKKQKKMRKKEQKHLLFTTVQLQQIIFYLIKLIHLTAVSIPVIYLTENGVQKYFA